MTVNIINNQIMTFKTIISSTLVGIMLLIQSCSESSLYLQNEPDSQTELVTKQTLTPDEYTFINKKYKVPAGMTKWEAQLDKMIENNQLLMKNGLKLVNYKYVRDVISVYDLETVKHELNRNNSFFVVYSNDGITDFTIGKSETVSKNYMKFLDYILPTSDSAITATIYKKETSSLAKIVYLFEKNDMGIVGLTWEYKGETLNTTCLVSKSKGVVFDKILLCIPFDVKQYTKIESNTSPKNQLKLISPPPPDGPVQCVHGYSDYRTNSSGSVMFWQYEITVTLHGQRREGVKYVTSPSVFYWSKPLDDTDPAHYIYGTWDCKAQANIVAFQDGPGGFVRYAYAWSYKHNGLVSISWNGIGYNVTGGGTSGGGIEQISVSDLN
jgi:hypothetical protein